MGSTISVTKAEGMKDNIVLQFVNMTGNFSGSENIHFRLQNMSVLDFKRNNDQDYLWGGTDAKYF
ncbi:MAG: hypothetical protein ACI93H_000688 [Psychromonas sp.]